MARTSDQTARDDIDLSISLRTLCFIIMKAREFAAKDTATDVDSGSNPSDDRQIAVLEDQPDDPALEELIALINDLTVDEQIDVVALSWLGREDYPDEWTTLRASAADAHNEHTAEYLCGNPLLADNLADGMSALDLSCAEFELQHL